MDTIVPPHDGQSNLTPKTTFIYALIDPETNEIRYIGKTDEPKKRLERHRNGHGGKTYKQRWVDDLKTRSQKPLMQIIEEISCDSWRERECYWIAYYLEQGCRLTNTSPGGLGPGNTAPETRAKIAKSLTGKKLSPESIEKRSAAVRGKKRPAEVGARISAARTGVKRAPFSENWKCKISISNKGQKRTPEAKARMSLAMKRSHAMRKTPSSNTPTLWD